jgi:hypothetical protein
MSLTISDEPTLREGPAKMAAQMNKVVATATKMASKMPGVLPKLPGMVRSRRHFCSRPCHCVCAPVCLVRCWCFCGMVCVAARVNEWQCKALEPFAAG